MRNLALIMALAVVLFTGAAGALPPPPDGGWDGGASAPEIDPTMAIGGIAALAGGLVVLRHYRRRK